MKKEKKHTALRLPLRTRQFRRSRVRVAIREKKSKYKLWWRTRQLEDRDAYLAAKREAKKAVSKAKSDRYKAV
ncbi:hypothetical protein NECAME_00410 [Necator americanus]|uniref:Uncharacterized protein n=1 Tax=Necator americanus TaxID=51031 RepID=W2TAZ6_NECAM|nr:hypothetical protein NECAME_00410 [Necator americanus]ETN79033.1 hypothetical protein NECAME_00410 [Necator americanus]